MNIFEYNKCLYIKLEINAKLLKFEVLVNINLIKH